MEHTYCANPNCLLHTERRGGHFRFNEAKQEWYCEDCYAGSRVAFSDGKNLWDFTTTHFTGERVHIRSRNHLDELCKRHGVSNHARENNERNWDRPHA